MPESKNGRNRDSQAGDVRGDAGGVSDGGGVPRWDADRTEPRPGGSGDVGGTWGADPSWTEDDRERPGGGGPLEIDFGFLDVMATERAERQLRRFRAGTVLLGRYRIVGELGRGGMGVVFRCLDETTNIHVAVKCVPPELSYNTEEMEEVLENFRLVYRLHHPHIAAVMTLDQDEDTGEYFLVMECVEGITLRRWRKQGEGGRRRLEEVLPLLEQVASALDYAHSEKIVHRDIKPSNIMLTADGKVKVLDFGLAAQFRTSLTRVSREHYGTGGTAPYMAPEQWRGVILGAATDQYALAVTAYELLAGRLPFENPDPAVLRQIVLHEEPAEIEDLPESAWAALARALRKEPEERFASCAAFTAALAGREPVEGAGAGSRAKEKWATRRVHGSGRARRVTGVENPCPHCGAGNPLTALYCGVCGADMTRACPECGEKNSVNLRYCSRCGTDVDGYLQATELLQRARSLVKEKRWTEALEEVRRVPDDLRLPGKKGQALRSDLAAVGEEAQATLERIQELRTRIEDAISGEDFAGALETFPEYLDLLSEDAAAEASALRAKVEEASKIVTLLDLRDAIGDLAGRKKYAAARRKAEEFEKVYAATASPETPHPMVKRGRGKAAGGVRAADVQAEVESILAKIDQAAAEAAALITAAREALQARLYEKAQGLLKQARKTYPENPAYVEVEERIRQGLAAERAAVEDLERRVATIEQRLSEKLFGVAWEEVCRAKDFLEANALPEQEILRARQRELEADLLRMEQRIETTSDRVADLVRTARETLDKGAYEQASDVLQQALTLWPSHPEASGLLETVNEKLAAERAAVEDLEQRVSEIGDDLKAGRLSAAREKLQAARAAASSRKVHPEEECWPRWTNALAALDDLEDQIEERERDVQGLITQAREELASGRLRPARNLLGAIERIDRGRAEREGVREVYETARRRRRRRMIAAAAVLAALAVPGVAAVRAFRFHQRVRAFTQTMQKGRIDAAGRFARLLESRFAPAQAYLRMNERRAAAKREGGASAAPEEWAAGEKALAAGARALAAGRMEEAVGAWKQAERNFSQVCAICDLRRDLAEVRSLEKREDWAAATGRLRGALERASGIEKPSPVLQAIRDECGARLARAEYEALLSPAGARVKVWGFEPWTPEFRTLSGDALKELLEKWGGKAWIKAKDAAASGEKRLQAEDWDGAVKAYEKAREALRAALATADLAILVDRAAKASEAGRWEDVEKLLSPVVKSVAPKVVAGIGEFYANLRRRVQTLFKESQPPRLRLRVFAEGVDFTDRAEIVVLPKAKMERSHRSVGALFRLIPGQTYTVSVTLPSKGDRSYTFFRKKLTADWRGQRGMRVDLAMHKTGDVMTVDLGGGVKMEMVWIPPGEFLLGSTTDQRKWAAGSEGKGDLGWYDDEGEDPRRCRIERGFWLGRTEVTVGQWKRFIAETGYKTDAEKRGEAWTPDWKGDGQWKWMKGKSWRDPNFAQDDDHPVVCISWNDATAFCKWLTERERKAGRLPSGYEYRLPGEAEWEYACRGGRKDASKFWWGEDWRSAEGRLNCAANDVFPDGSRWSLREERWEDGYVFTSPVDAYGSPGRNGYGLADMLGNVWEWCYDWYDSSGASCTIRMESGEYRVLRGGSFGDIPGLVRCAYRNRFFPTIPRADSGARLCCAVSVVH